MSEFTMGESVVLAGYVVKIDAITKTGIIRIGSRTFRPDGRERGYGDYSRIQKLTPDLERQIADRATRITIFNSLHDISETVRELSLNWKRDDRRWKKTETLKIAADGLRAALDKALAT